MASYWTDDKLEALALSVIGESRELSLNGVTMNFPRIAYLHCDAVKKSGGLYVHADSEKVSDKNKAIMKKDFIITFYDPNNEDLTDEQMRILMEHELLHIGYDADKDSYFIRPHDYGEFKEIIDKYGIDWCKETK